MNPEGRLEDRAEGCGRKPGEKGNTANDPKAECEPTQPFRRKIDVDSGYAKKRDGRVSERM